jgi:3-hydroxybutyryl-CoA dehydrogenase
MAIERIGVIGAGQMGTGISHVLALAGYDVMLDDVNKDALGKALDRIEKNMQRQAAKGAINADLIPAALKRIHTTQTLDDLKDRDLVIEAATEDEAIKKKIFQDLCTRIADKAIIATNTSSISVTRLAASTDRPEHFIGLHFMNPVPVMQLVEVIRGIATNDATFQAALEIVKKTGKTAAYAEDFPAFIVNRILLPMINEAVYTL